MRELAGGRMTFDENAIYIVGNAKSSQNNPITQLYGQFFLGFVVEKASGKILACGISATISVTSDFVSSLFVGRSLLDEAESVKKLVENRYFGSSQKAILVAFKDAQKKYNQILSGQTVDLSD
jgi:hypothetical protein